MAQVTKLCKNIYIIDGFDCGLKERTGTYVLTEENLTIIETSASPSVPHIINGLNKLNYDLTDIKNIIVTHIHLDHAGGAGLLLQKCPNATVFVHPRGLRHLVDPTRLIAGAKAVYGSQFDELFDPIIPIPKHRLIAKQDGDNLKIGPECTLKFYDTPGHANHHFSIFHPNAKGIFSGDTAGVRYPSLAKDGIEYCLPSTSPNQFNPEKMLAAIDLYESLEIDKIFFGHYSMSTNPQQVYKLIRKWVPIFVNEAESAVKKYNEMSEQISSTIESLTTLVIEDLTNLGVPNDHEVYDVISLDISVSSMGLIDYLNKK